METQCHERSGVQGHGGPLRELGFVEVRSELSLITPPAPFALTTASIRTAKVKSRLGRCASRLDLRSDQSVIFSELLGDFGNDHTRLGDRGPVDHRHTIRLEIHPL